MSAISKDVLVQATASIVAARLTTSAMLSAAGKPTVLAAQPLDDIFFETYRSIEKALDRIDVAEIDRVTL
jgi:hypothetical protein